MKTAKGLFSKITDFILDFRFLLMSIVFFPFAWVGLYFNVAELYQKISRALIAETNVNASLMDTFGLSDFIFFYGYFTIYGLGLLLALIGTGLFFDGRKRAAKYFWVFGGIFLLLFIIALFTQARFILYPLSFLVKFVEYISNLY